MEVAKVLGLDSGRHASLIAAEKPSTRGVENLGPLP